MTLTMKLILATATRGQLCRSINLNKRVPFALLRRSSTFSSKNVAEKRIVYHSLSKNIYKNLALEEWIFDNTDLSSTDVLLVWQSNPCVVIGRHQNPWTETNLALLERETVSLARRSSGGGAVYHDNGNLNLSFMKDRTRYDRRENLELVVAALRLKWNLDLSINDRDDIVLDGAYKVSGTAAKLTRNKSYHHFTLLHSVERSKLSGMLSSPLKDIGDSQRKEPIVESRSTPSVSSSIENLQARAPDMTFDLMRAAIVGKFLDDLAVLSSQTHLVEDPLDEKLFPGVSEIYSRLQTWEWVYGKTPKFSLKMDVTSAIDNQEDGGSLSVHGICITIEKGRLSSYEITLSDGTSIDLAYVNNTKGIEVKKDNSKFFVETDLLFGNSFSHAYPRIDVERISRRIQKELAGLIHFL